MAKLPSLHFAYAKVWRKLTRHFCLSLSMAKMCRVLRRGQLPVLPIKTNGETQDHIFRLYKCMAKHSVGSWRGLGVFSPIVLMHRMDPGEQQRKQKWQNPVFTYANVWQKLTGHFSPIAFNREKQDPSPGGSNSFGGPVCLSKPMAKMFQWSFLTVSAG